MNTPVASPNPDPLDPTSFLARLREELRDGAYRSCDVVELIGGFTGNTRLMKINANPDIPLSRCQWLVLLVLMAHHRTARGLPTPRRIVAESHLTAQEILNALEEWKKDDPTAAWNADATAVHRVIHKLRRKLADAGFPNLIQSWRKEVGGGYGLATPALNLIITLTAPFRPRPGLQLRPSSTSM
jgi:hypothetical protein